MPSALVSQGTGANTYDRHIPSLLEQENVEMVAVAPNVRVRPTARFRTHCPTIERRALLTPGHQDLTLHALRGVLDRSKHQDTIRWLRKQFRIDDRGRLAAHPRPGLARTGLAGYLVATAHNLVHMVNLISGLGTAPGPPDPAEGSTRPKGVPPGLRGPRILRVGPRRGLQGPSDHLHTDSAHHRCGRWHPKPVLPQPVGLTDAGHHEPVPSDWETRDDRQQSEEAPPGGRTGLLERRVSHTRSPDGGHPRAAVPMGGPGTGPLEGHRDRHAGRMGLHQTGQYNGVNSF